MGKQVTMKKPHPAKAGKLRVSQSMIKDMRAHLSKQLCGHVLEAKYVTRTMPEEVEDPNTSACNTKLVGSFFEWIVSGALPKSGEVPMPKYMKSKGVTGRKEDFYEPYRTAVDNGERVKAMFKEMGIEVIAAGVHVTKGDHEATLDIVARYKGKVIIIDLKHSGMLDNKWDEYGWALMTQDGDNIQKRFHGTQAKEYSYVADEALVKLKLKPQAQVPFYFFVKDSGNNDSALWLEVEVDDVAIKHHVAEAAKTLSDMKFFQEIGFTPYPELNRCSKCPLRDTCVDRAKVPTVQKVDLINL